MDGLELMNGLEILITYINQQKSEKTRLHPTLPHLPFLSTSWLSEDEKVHSHDVQHDLTCADAVMVNLGERNQEGREKARPLDTAVEPVSVLGKGLPGLTAGTALKFSLSQE